MRAQCRAASRCRPEAENPGKSVQVATQSPSGPIAKSSVKVTSKLSTIPHPMLLKWNRLHAVRTVLGGLAVAAYLIALAPA